MTRHRTVERTFTFAGSVISAACLCLPSFAAGGGGATYTPGTDSHLDMQHQIGAKTSGTVDCGRAAEADLRALEGDGKTFNPSPEIAEIIGTRAPEFSSDLQWINSPPLTVAGLRGHPVFIRFWYRNCPMCISSAPLMNELQDRYSKDGLIIIGIHHSKTITGDSVEQVTKAASELGFKFPIAIDNSWKTISAFWIHGSARAYSSASFLIDKDGIVVWGQDLGRLQLNTAAASSLHDAIQKQLNVSSLTVSTGGTKP